MSDFKHVNCFVGHKLDGLFLGKTTDSYATKTTVLRYDLKGVNLSRNQGVNLKWRMGVSLIWREGVNLRGFSTYVALAAKLFSNGMENGGSGKRFVKYTVNLTGSLPSSVKVFTDQSHISEELALAELINDTDCIKDNIVVFDRGLQSRDSFDKFTKNNKFFVTRANFPVRCKVISQNEISLKPVNNTVTITSDEIAFLINRKNEQTQYRYRVIKAIIDENGQKICFVTNMLDKEAYTIAQWYRQRWEIEIFFKFIKQHLNVKHLASRDKNGIKVMIYMTMILATLIIVYKKINKIKSYKIAKLRFEIELDNEAIKAIVMLCGGDPARATHLFNSG